MSENPVGKAYEQVLAKDDECSQKQTLHLLFESVFFVQFIDFMLNDEDIVEIKNLDQKISYTNRPETMLKEQNY